MDDAELVVRAVKGDEVAFELLVRRNVDHAWRLASSMLRDDFTAEEAVQDAFLKAHASLASFRGDASFKTWLLAICRRGCLDRLRSTKAEVVPLERAQARRSAREDEHIQLALEQAMGRLSQEEKEAFVLVDVMGHSREEAASIVGTPASTMRSRVARARERLAIELSDSDEATNGG